ncbi:MAG: Hint domain-containing protein, partial [Nostoc sp.]
MGTKKGVSARQEWEEALQKIAPAANNIVLWKSLPGPQTMAYESLADELFYGGAAGGGKSDLILGLALTAHQNSIIFRREYPQLKGLVQRCKKILKGTKAKYNSTEKVWNGLPEQRNLEFGACQHEDDVEKYQGRPHDLKCLGAGTPVWMADGTKKPIEQIQTGDRVLTLDGERLVTKLYRQVKPALLVKAFIKGH